MAASGTDTAWLSRGVAGIGGASLLSDLGHEIPTALLPSLLTSVLHAPASVLGIIEGVSDAAAGVAQLAGGALADDPERRRRVAVGGYTAVAVLSAGIGAEQGRVAGENALGGSREFAGSLGTQVVKIFDHAAARTGLRDHEAVAAGFEPVTIGFEADDHKAYYPGSHRIAMRFTGDKTTGRLLGVQLFGHRHAEIAKRVDIAAAAIFHGMTVDAVSDLDLSYTPPLGSPWDAVQMGAQAWTRGVKSAAPVSRTR